MPLVKFKSDLNPAQAVGSLRLTPAEDGTERILHRDGEPLEITDAEYASVQSLYVFEVLDAPETQSEAPVDTSSVQTTPVVPTSPTTQSASASPDKTPAQGS